ncbi:MAG TPA: CHASE domain-containing protein, partial [Marinagarivorans sp.]
MKPAALHLIIACLGYYLAGLFGLMLAIPPGFASAVWPAAGIAVACAMMLRPAAVIAGVAIGSFSLNLGVISGNFSAFSLSMFGPALCIAFGASLQTLSGYLLWQALVKKETTLNSPKHIYQFLLIIAPVCCLVSAVVGTTTLALFGLVSSNGIAFTGITWWVGDTIGVILFTPLVLTLARKNNDTRTRATIVAPTLLIFTGILLLFLSSLKAHEKTILQEVKRNALYFQNKVHERLTISEHKLAVYSALYNTAETISREQFNRMSETFLRDDNAINAIGWIEIVPHEKRQAFEAAIRQQGYPNFTLTELTATGDLITARKREQYYPVTFVYPFPPNIAAFGLDLGTAANRLEALELARDSGAVVSTPPVRLAQAVGDERAIVMFLPIFDLNYRRQFHSPEYAKAHLRGYINGIFDINDILGDIFDEAAKKHFGIKIYDTTAPGGAELLISSGHKHRASTDPIRSQFTFGQRQLTLEFYANSHFHSNTRNWASWAILTIGFLLAAMLQALLLVLTGTQERIQREVARKTADLLQAKQDAEKASHAKSAFLANMSHEFRTPLNAIIGFTNLCLKTPLNDRQAGFLNRVQLASESLLAHINQTLEYSKIESHTLKLKCQATELVRIYGKLEAMFLLQAEQKGVAFSIELLTEHPRYVVTDPLRLEQILINLCGNALKFTDQGHITLRSTVTTQDDNNLTLRIDVIDTGIGIPPEHQQTIFDAFQQVDNSTSRRYGGTGLGLTITRQLIELLGGSIALKSQPGKGSHFTLRLNCKPAPSDYPASDAASPSPELSPQMQLKIFEENLQATQQAAGETKRTQTTAAQDATHDATHDTTKAPSITD